MAEYDLRLDLPALAYINAQLALLLEQGGTFWDAKQHLFSQSPYLESGLNAYDYKFRNQSLAISLLFCTIVVPREFLDLPGNHKIFQDFDTEKVPGLFAIRQPTNCDSYTFLRCLRHSIAHALFSITSEEGEIQYEFWTERNPILHATASHHELMRFIEVVGKRLANAVLEQKAKPEV